jgi:hypothetical protein
MRLRAGFGSSDGVRRKLERFGDRQTHRILLGIRWNRANPARAGSKAQHRFSLGRRQRKAPAVDRIEKVPGSAGNRRVRRAHVMRNATTRRTDQAKQDSLRAAAMPLDGVVNEGAHVRGIGHDLKLQLPPGAPAAGV